MEGHVYAKENERGEIRISPPCAPGGSASRGVSTKFTFKIKIPA